MDQRAREQLRSGSPLGAARSGWLGDPRALLVQALFARVGQLATSWIERELEHVDGSPLPPIVTAEHAWSVLPGPPLMTVRVDIQDRVWIRDFDSTEREAGAATPGTFSRARARVLAGQAENLERFRDALRAIAHGTDPSLGL